MLSMVNNENAKIFRNGMRIFFFILTPTNDDDDINSHEYEEGKLHEKTIKEP